MRRFVLLLVAAGALTGSVAYTASESGQADEEAAPIFGVKIPLGYRDWRLISVAHEEGNLSDLRAILGNDMAIKAYRKGSVCSRMAQSLPGSPGTMSRRKKTTKPLAVSNPSSPGCPKMAFVHGQGLEKIRLDRRLGVRSIQRRQTGRRGGVQHLLSLP
jgi:hypothetical protein